MAAGHHYGAVLFWMSAGALALEGIAARLDWVAGRYAAPPCGRSSCWRCSLRPAAADTRWPTGWR